MRALPTRNRVGFRIRHPERESRDPGWAEGAKKDNERAALPPQVPRLTLGMTGEQRPTVSSRNPGLYVTSSLRKAGPGPGCCPSSILSRSRRESMPMRFPSSTTGRWRQPSDCIFCRGAADLLVRDARRRATSSSHSLPAWRRDRGRGRRRGSSDRARRRCRPVARSRARRWRRCFRVAHLPRHVPGRCRMTGQGSAGGPAISSAICFISAPVSRARVFLAGDVFRGRRTRRTCKPRSASES